MSTETGAGTQYVHKYVNIVMAMVVGALVLWGLQWSWNKVQTIDGHPREVDDLAAGYYEAIFANKDYALVKSVTEGPLLIELSSEAAKALPAKSTTPAFLVVREDDGKRVYEWASPEAPPTIEPPPAATDSPRS